MRAASVPNTPGSIPAAPIKEHGRSQSHPSSDEGTIESEGTKPRNLSSAFDAVVTKSEPSLQTAASVISPVDYCDAIDEVQSHSLSLPLPQAPVAPDALPKGPDSEMAEPVENLKEQPLPADKACGDASTPVKGTLVPADQAEVCPPSPPQSRPGKDTVAPQETLTSLYKGATFPHDESERLRTVALLGILGQPEDQVLASITKLVTRLMKVSTAGQRLPAWSMQWH